MGANQATSDDLVRRLRSHVDVLANLIGPRFVGVPSALHAAKHYIERQFAEVGDSVTHETYRAGHQEVANLVVERQGTGPRPKIIIIGAHYDTVPGTPGADDNASAVAMLIEVARLLRPKRAKHTIRFVAFTCEEPPHYHTGEMGSQVHARNCQKRGDQVAAMICLEMVGFYSDRPASQAVPPGIPPLLRWVFPSRGNFLAAVGNVPSTPLVWSFRRGFKKASKLRLFSIALPETISDIRRSDNASFWDQGYRALMITDTSFLRNQHYHRESDTPDTLDYARLGLATEGVAGAVAHLAQ